VTYIDTDGYSGILRTRAVLPDERKVLIARLTGSEQENDLTLPPNCDGYGRIRHFRLYRYDDWTPNPLPILPAAKALGQSPGEELRAQVFQNAACNWRCWYCYVDFNRLSADQRYSEYLTADQLIDRYLSQPDPPSVIDLSGGQPDIVPEWTLWMMQALRDRGLAGQVFLWSDDNLSNSYFWTYLSEMDRLSIAKFPNYCRVGCFKGYDPFSFSFNTSASPDLFIRQFSIYKRLLEEGIDMYAYITFTSPKHRDLGGAVRAFIDSLQEIHENLPLRAVPLKISAFTPTAKRMRMDQGYSLSYQHEVHAEWVSELRNRFSTRMLELPICDVQLLV
jgi:uncharacterized Fe-S cluster-containing radical SAM superfamily protein